MSIRSHRNAIRLYACAGRSSRLKAGLILLTVLVFFSILGQFWTPYSVTRMDASAVDQAPSLRHIMGTDNFGRDVFSRVMNGSGTTFLVALSTVAIGCAAGTTIGALTGYYGGWLDRVLMRINDIVLSFPSVLLALIVVSLLGSGTGKVILTLGILFIPSFARITRSEVIRIKDLDYIRMARIQKVKPLRLIFRHILPNARTSILSSCAIGFNNAVLAEASMSYLGLGVQPPIPSLGRMLSEAQPYLYTCPWYALFPGLTIILMILSFSLITDGLDEHE